MTNKKFLISALMLAGVASTAIAAPSAEVTLQGIITDTTCNVTVNGGKSTLNVGVFRTTDFAVANSQVGSVPLSVELTDCTAAENGNLMILGETSTKNNDKNLFVNNYADKVGFMIKDSAGAQVTTSSQVNVPVAINTPVNYSFAVGMGSVDSSPEAGVYSAPIIVAYIVQ